LRPWLAGCSGWPGSSSPDAGSSACGTRWALIDILFVVATALRLAIADPESMNALLHLPLSLLVTFLVPLIIADHVVVFWRIAARRKP
jgi:hypothetical protein